MMDSAKRKECTEVGRDCPGEAVSGFAVRGRPIFSSYLSTLEGGASNEMQVIADAISSRNHFRQIARGL